MPGPAPLFSPGRSAVSAGIAVRAIAAAVVAVGFAVGVLVLGVAPALAVSAHVLSLPAIGSAGSGAGQLELAASSEVAVNDQTGDIYVADTGNRRVDEFNDKGEFQFAFGANVGGSGVDVCTTNCQKGASGSMPGAFEVPLLVAVDNSSGPSKGDVYVGDTGDSTISKFTSLGSLIKTWGVSGQLTGFAVQNGSLAGITVVPGGGSGVEGGLFASITDGFTFRFEEDGTPSGAPFFMRRVSPDGLGVDAEGRVYELVDGTVERFGSSGDAEGFELGGEGRGVGLASDTSNNDLYLTQKAGSGEGGDVQVFADTCATDCHPLEEFAFEPGELKAPQGLAVDPITHIVYVADSSTNQIDVYALQEVPPPTVEIEAPSEVSYTTAKVTGKVNPNGHLTTCRFEYALSASFVGAKSTPCASNPGNGSSSVAVEVELSGLRGSAEYHVRLVAENRGIPGNTLPSSSVSLHTLTVVPSTITGPIVSGVTSTSAHFAGQVNPNAPAGNPPAFDVDWEFQCSPACPGLVGGTVAADDTSHEVSEVATGLQPGQEYKVVLLGTNANGVPVSAGPVSFTTPAVAPSVISSTVASGSGTEATLTSQIDPGGAPTTYHYEYVTEAQYLSNGETFQGAEKTAESAPVGEAGDNTDHEAQATITGLSPNTNYRFRILAKNDVTSASGEAELLFTHSTEGFSGCENEALRAENDSQLLPDCRAYEQVSPADNAEVFAPFGQNPSQSAIDESQWPMQASGNGEALAYVAEPAGSGVCEGTGNAGSGEGDEYLAVRGEGGWSSCDIQPLASVTETGYEAFSDGLAGSVLRAGKDEELATGVAGHCDLLYARPGSGPFTALFRPEVNDECGELTTFFVGASSDYSQIAFESKEALAEGAVASSGELGHENIYDSAAGTVRTVNVLPGASPSPAPDATIGELSNEPSIRTGPGGKFPAVNTSRAVSANGSAIFWTNLTGTSHVIYARMNPAQEQSAIEGGGCTEAAKACTLQVSAGPATYQTATPDGRYAYYTEAGELWRYDTQSQTREELAGTGANVQGVIGVNETGQDGAYLYFIAESKLAPGAEARKCEAAPTDSMQDEEELGKAPTGYGCNLYLIHEAQTSLAAVLAPSDNEFKGNTFNAAQPKKGDWRPVLGYRSAQLSANGQSLAFMSNRQLSDYQNINHDGECGGGGEHPTHSCAEIYLFNAQNNKISCASCTPSGAPPVESKDAQNHEGRATYLPGDFGSITHTRRLISANGNRVFFDSDQPLSPQDKNGVQDVYEWEQEGEGKEGRCAKGSASNGGGCVYLLSGGTSTSDSLLLDTDETGSNVFFVSRAALVPGGGNGEKPNVFDARVNGGFKGAPGSIIQPPECKSAEECKEPAGEPPVESFPASAAFSGAGNLIAPLEATKPLAEKPAVRKLTRAQELAKALKACAKDKAKAKRQQCAKQARKKYGPIKKQASKKAKQKGKR
jgi:hypothetical protein